MLSFTTNATSDTTGPVFTSAPAASNVSDNSAVIHWETNEPSTSTVKYGTDANNLNTQAASSGLTTIHNVTITNLSPQTTYYFTAVSIDGSNNGSESGPVGQFTTLSSDNVPDPFTFNDQSGVALNTVIASNSITVSGINFSSPISITGGTYSVNGGAFTANSGTVNNGDSVIVRQTSSNTYSSTTTATLTIGGVNGAFNVTTMAIPTYTVTPTAGSGGSISPSTTQTVNYNQTTSFTLTPNTGYHISSVAGCGGALSGNTYTTGPITADCTVSALFASSTYIEVCPPDSGVCVTFPPGCDPGEVSANVSTNNPGEEQWGFKVIGPGGNPIYHNVSPTNHCATTETDPIKVCMQYDDTGLSLKQEQNLKIRHWDGADWEEVSCSRPEDVPNPDTDSNTICACVTSLSWFAVGYADSAPVANNKSMTTTQDTPVAITLTASDPDGDPLAYTVVSNPSHGALGGTAPNLTYTPDTGYYGLDSFTFKANDSTSDSNTATVSITVNPLAGDIVAFLPIGDEVLPSGGIYGICWQAPLNAVKFDLLYTINGRNWLPIMTALGLKCVNWELPVVTANKKNCYAKVIAYDSNNVKIGEGISEQFTIEVLRITSPNGGEVLRPGSTWNIGWKSFETIRPVAKTKLLYSINGGTTWSLIKTFKGDPGSTTASYNWTVPYVSSTKCKVKVVLKDATGVNMGADTSDKVFTIVP